MTKSEFAGMVQELLEIRDIKELMADVREELQDRRKFRREYLLKMDDIIFYLGKVSRHKGQTRKRRRFIWKKK